MLPESVDLFKTSEPSRHMRTIIGHIFANQQMRLWSSICLQKHILHNIFRISLLSK